MAVSDATGVANLALGRIGSKIISDIAGSGNVPETCNLYYEDVRDEVCGIIPWTCLQATTTLSLGDGSTVSNFSGVHTLAATVLIVVNINGKRNIPFERRKTNLYTNETSGYFVHTAKETDPSLWDRLLLAAVEARLTSKIAVRLAGNTQMALMAFQEYMTILMMAIKRDLSEGDAQEYLQMVAGLAQMFPSELYKSRPVITG